MKQRRQVYAVCASLIALRNDALQTRDRYELQAWNGPGPAVHRFAEEARAAPHPGHNDLKLAPMMTRLSIRHPAGAGCLRSEHHLGDHGLMRHFAAERRKLVKIIASSPPRLRAQRRIEIAHTVELHLRQQKCVTAAHRKRVG